MVLTLATCSFCTLLVEVNYYSKTPCQSQNRRSPGPASMRPQAECLPDSDDAPCGEMCNFYIGMGCCFYPMTCKKQPCGKCTFLYSPFCMKCILVIGFYTKIWNVFRLSAKYFLFQAWTSSIWQVTAFPCDTSDNSPFEWLPILPLCIACLLKHISW